MKYNESQIFSILFIYRNTFQVCNLSMNGLKCSIIKLIVISAFWSELTKRRSSEKIWQKGGRNYPDPASVQGLLELALLKIRSLNYPNVVLSSRTDGGVHALNASAHFDLEKYGSQIYEPRNIEYTFNKYFYTNNISITVKKCYTVSDDFNARYKAISRTYLYRLAVLKQDIVLPEYSNIGCVIPIEEWKRCYCIRGPGFDIERLKEGAKYLVGYHDFTTFRRFDKIKQNKHNRRQLVSIHVNPGRPLVTSFSGQQDGVFDYWDIEFKGRAFVHNQIRRMMGTLISVATGKLEPEQIKVMLQIPSKHSWHNFIKCSPPDGLYLCNVEYRPEDLVYDPGNTENSQL